MCEAVPPESLNEEQEAALEALIAESAEMADPCEVITVAMIGVPPRPKDGVQWQHESTLLPSIAPRGVTPAAPIGS